MASTDKSLFVAEKREETFADERRLGKRRASSQKKNGANTACWPHKEPLPQELARAGFYYDPTEESVDNTVCYICKVRLDGWESGDIPLDEHLAHSKACPWAVSMKCSQEGEDRDPMGEELVDARRATYSDLWPHEKKRGWKAKTKKMVEAGWCYDPSKDADDGATCFYCNTSLDGWEPQDNPLEEHRRRAPECAFFVLLDQHKPTRVTKAKRGRTSTASKASRLSTQSIMSNFSEAPSLMSLGDAAAQTDVDMDESLAVDTTMTSDTSTTKGRKKATKPKAAPKGRKKAKKETVDPQPEEEPESVTYPAIAEPETEKDHAQEPEMEQEQEPGPEQEEEQQPEPEPEPEQEPEPVVAPAKSTRGRKLKRVDDSLADQSSEMDVDPPAKAKRGRAKTKKVDSDPPPEELSEGESQLQSELQEAASFASAQQSPPAQKKRGVKRTSDGVEKSQDSIAESVVEEAPAKPKKAAKTIKAKKGKKVAKEVQEDDASTEVAVAQAEAKPKRGRKPKKTVQQEELELEESQPEVAAPEIVEAAPDEAEEQVEEPHLEAHDEDVVMNSVVGHEDDQADEPEAYETAQDDDNEENPEAPAAEFEPTPTPQKPRASYHHAPSSAAARPTPRAITTRNSTANSSPQSSDAENQRPSSSSRRDPNGTAKKTSNTAGQLTNMPTFSIPPPTSEQRLAAAATAAVQSRSWLSPSKPSRIPLAPGTPSLNRSPLRHQRSSPSKTLGRLTSTTAWDAVDLESVLFPLSPEKESGNDSFADRLRVAAGDDGGAAAAAAAVVAGDASLMLSKEEKKMSVEEWVRWRAETGEKKLRVECERMVGVFEREGGRALEVLAGIQTTTSTAGSVGL